jgi:uncharacterized protein (TIGR02996 family)
MDEETAFVNAILASPRDDTVRLVFADWLDERNDPRDEWLRVTVRLQQLVWNFAPVESRAKQLWVREVAQLQRRLRELRSLVSEAWALRIQRGLIESCNIADAKCPNEWLRLPESDRPDRRQCSSCERFVRYCRSAAEVHQAMVEMQPLVKALALEPDRNRRGNRGGV